MEYLAPKFYFIFKRVHYIIDRNGNTREYLYTSFEFSLNQTYRPKRVLKQKIMIYSFLHEGWNTRFYFIKVKLLDLNEGRIIILHFQAITSSSYENWFTYHEECSWWDWEISGSITFDVRCIKRLRKARKIWFYRHNYLFFK